LEGEIADQLGMTQLGDTAHAADQLEFFGQWKELLDSMVLLKAGDGRCRRRRCWRTNCKCNDFLNGFI
jgi:hypothetical protein